MDELLTKWPATPEELEALQRGLAERARAAEPWAPGDFTGVAVAAVFVAFPTGLHGPGAASDPAWAGAVLWRAGLVVAEALVRGQAGAPYVAGLLALRCGPLQERAVRALLQRPDVLLVDATGRDHPRRAGLALHLGAVLDLPSVGVTNRALVADCAGPESQPAPAPAPRPESQPAPAWEPGPRRGDVAPLVLAGETVGMCVRVREGGNALIAHAGWRTSPETAAGLVLALTGGRRRTPEPLRRARTLARLARARDEGRLSWQREGCEGAGPG